MSEHYRITRERQRLEDMREVDVTTMTAYKRDVNVGRIQWVTETGEIVHLYVPRDCRRQGIATRLYQAASKENLVRHSHQRTDDGQAWALSLGDQLPTWDRV